MTTRNSPAPETVGPRLSNVLATLAYHVAVIFAAEVPPGETRRGTCGVATDARIEAPAVVISWEIRGDHEQPVWHACRIATPGTGGELRGVGNRCGLRNAIVAAYAPIVAEAARLDAADAAARSAA